MFCYPSQGINVGKAKTEEKDPKKLKKQEKEEKDLRKKFKVCNILYHSEFKVLMKKFQKFQNDKIHTFQVWLTILALSVITFLCYKYVVNLNSFLQ